MKGDKMDSSYSDNWGAQCWDHHYGDVLLGYNFQLCGPVPCGRTAQKNVMEIRRPHRGCGEVDDRPTWTGYQWQLKRRVGELTIYWPYIDIFRLKTCKIYMWCRPRFAANRSSTTSGGLKDLGRFVAKRQAPNNAKPSNINSKEIKSMEFSRQLNWRHNFVSLSVSVSLFFYLWMHRRTWQRW
jgi:hypothetical protein